MKSNYKTVSLQSRFPLLGVEKDCILSKGGDITVCFEVTLPEVFTLSGAEYEALHAV